MMRLCAISLCLLLFSMVTGEHISCPQCFVSYPGLLRGKYVYYSCAVERLQGDGRSKWTPIRENVQQYPNQSPSTHFNQTQLWNEISQHRGNSVFNMHVFSWPIQLIGFAGEELLPQYILNIRHENTSVDYHLVSILQSYTPAEISLVCTTSTSLQGTIMTELKGQVNQTNVAASSISIGTKNQLKSLHGDHVVNNTEDTSVYMRFPLQNSSININNLQFHLVNSKSRRGCNYRDIIGYGSSKDDVVTFGGVMTGNYTLVVRPFSDTDVHLWIIGNLPTFQIYNSYKAVDPRKFNLNMSLSVDVQTSSVGVSVWLPTNEFACLSVFNLTLLKGNMSIDHEFYYDEVVNITTIKKKRHTTEYSYEYENLEAGYYYEADVQYAGQYNECRDFEESIGCPWPIVQTKPSLLPPSPRSPPPPPYNFLVILVLTISSFVFVVGIFVTIVYLAYKLSNRKKFDVQSLDPTELRRRVKTFHNNLSDTKKAPVLLLHANDDQEQFPQLMQAFETFLKSDMQCEVFDIYEYNDDMYVKGAVEWIRGKVGSSKVKVILVVSDEGCRVERTWMNSRPIKHHELYIQALSAILQKQNALESVYVVRFSDLFCSEAGYRYISPRRVYTLTRHLVALAMDLHGMKSHYSELSELPSDLVWSDSESYKAMKTFTHPVVLSRSDSTYSSLDEREADQKQDEESLLPKTSYQKYTEEQK